MNEREMNIYLAPFQGITGWVFREVYSRHFPYVDKLFTPFFTNTRSKGKPDIKYRELKSTTHSGIPVVPQILSNDAGEMIRFATVCRDMGYDEINWNLGCPFRRVAIKRRGSGLMMYPGQIEAILEEIIPDLPLSLSVKCRLGYETPTEILRMMSVFNAFDLKEIIIHARLGRQLYKGDVNLPGFVAALNLSELPVVYNGDIFGVDDIRQFAEHTGPLAGWMIGRGLLVDPFLPADIKKEDVKGGRKRVEVVRRYVDDLYFEYRKYLNDRLHAIHIMKELWEYLAYGFDRPGKVFDKVKKSNSFDQYEEAVHAIFKQYEWMGCATGNFRPEQMSNK